MAVRRPTGQALAGIAIIAAYVGAANLGASLADVAGTVTAVWPPSGIALAALAIFGIRMWPALLAGVVVAEITLGLPLGTAALIGVGNTLEAVVGLWLMRRIAGFRPTLERVSDVVSLSLLGGLACTIAASVGTLALWQHGLVEQDALGLTWLVWWAGDVGGVLVVAPALMALATIPWRRGVDRRRALERVSWSWWCRRSCRSYWSPRPPTPSWSRPRWCGPACDSGRAGRRCAAWRSPAWWWWSPRWGPGRSSMGPCSTGCC